MQVRAKGPSEGIFYTQHHNAERTTSEQGTWRVEGGIGIVAWANKNNATSSSLVEKGHVNAKSYEQEATIKWK